MRGIVTCYNLFYHLQPSSRNESSSISQQRKKIQQVDQSKQLQRTLSSELEYLQKEINQFEMESPQQTPREIQVRN